MDKAVSFYQADIFDAFGFVVGGESNRHGGISSKPYQSLNLGLNTNDDYKNVTENRKRLFDSLNISPKEIFYAKQIHRNKVLAVDGPGQATGYDALITRRKNIFLTITVADCTPVLIFDQANQAIAAIHAGWRGTAGHIVEKTLDKMRGQYGTKGSDCYAYVGTCIDENSFEVDVDVARHFADSFKRWDESLQKYFVDLKAANVRQLTDFGIAVQRIEVSPYSTVIHNEDYFSYRKENGDTGRMLAIIGMRG